MVLTLRSLSYSTFFHLLLLFSGKGSLNFRVDLCDKNSRIKSDSICNFCFFLNIRLIYIKIFLPGDFFSSCIHIFVSGDPFFAFAPFAHCAKYRTFKSTSVTGPRFTPPTKGQCPQENVFKNGNKSIRSGLKLP